MRFRISRVAMATVLFTCVAGNAYALGFGRLRVQSALGQPLRAEVELTDAQAASLKAGMAPSAVYAQKGLEYAPVIKGIHSSVRQMPNGQKVLVLSSDAPINEPFIDVVLQASDGAGSVTRDFSILLDPPAASQPSVAVVEPLTPRTSEAARVSPVAPIASRRVDLPSAEGEGKPPTGSRAVAQRKEGALARGGSVRVSQGDTAGRIAALNRPAHVSLDQMLVALQRANSHAFINGNVHQLKSGAVLRMPSASEVRAVPAAEARTLVIAQSEDFRAYRNRLARSPMAQAAPSPQQSGGKVQSRVEDTRTSSAAAPDTLTISKADIKNGKTAEQRMAETMQKRDNTNRAEELNKNLSDLKNISAEASASAQQAGKVQSGTGVPVVVAPPGMASSAVAASTAVLAASQVAEGASASVGAVSAASAAASAEKLTASAAASAVSAPASGVAPRKKPVQSPPLPPEPGFLESLIGNPVFKGGMGLIAVGGLVYVFLRQRRKNRAEADSDSSFTESNYTPDSFFHASGGKDIDTSEPTAAGSGSLGANQSSMLYSPSQLDAEADVDPVSEADVYLAYGRDIQAEEILKDALVKYPERMPIYVKLLEMYARRHDVKAYAHYATVLKRLTQGNGPEWDAACVKGAEIDPENSLYAASATATRRPEVQSAATAVSADFASAGAAAGAVASAIGAHAVDTDPVQPSSVRTDLLQQPTMSPMTVPVTESASAAKGDPSAMSLIDLTLDMPEEDAFPVETAQESEADRNPDFDLENLSPATVPVVSSSTYSPPESVIDLTLDMPDEAPSSISAPLAARAAGSGLDFDMNGLSLDLDLPKAPETQASDPLITKLALAREFLTIGDNEGARAMAQEVAQKASGELKAQAEVLLASIL